MITKKSSRLPTVSIDGEEIDAVIRTSTNQAIYSQENQMDCSTNQLLKAIPAFTKIILKL